MALLEDHMMVDILIVTCPIKAIKIISQVLILVISMRNPLWKIIKLCILVSVFKINAKNKIVLAIQLPMINALCRYVALNATNIKID